MEKRWHLLTPDADVVSAIVVATGCHPVAARLLANRGITTPEQAEAFLNATIAHLRPPTGIKDLDTAVRRLSRAIRGAEHILVLGDYDVDGTTATALLLEFLTACGARVSYHIPHRLTEGYGLQERHISEVAVPRGAALVVTVDCGTSSHAAVDAAQKAGVDVIVTDHHTVGDRLPRALAVVNPKRPDCPAGLERLAGVGVAFCLVIALRRHLRELGFWQGREEPNLRRLCDLVALGTIADLVPLQEENRILARAGLELISAGRRPGLAALMQAAGVSGRPADADDVAFRLGPRLNAAGRIDHAATVVELLTTACPERSRRIAHQLNALNTSRQEIERGIMADLDEMIAREPGLLGGRSLVLAHPGWHEGVIGIVSSKVMERYYRPVVLIALKGETGRGSARCIPGIDLYACLSACRPHLEELGGHAQAAGLKVSARGLPAFRQAFELAVRSAAGPEAFIPAVTVEGELGFEEITEELADHLEALMPFGAGNPEPLFMARNVSVVSSERVGSHHRRMTLRQEGGRTDRTLRAIHFHAGAEAAALDRFGRMAFRLRWNRWNASRTLQLVVEEVSAR
jgi:single-stranded-DNA-specific exonuclease